MSDRFESYEQTLRNTLSESKEALTSKGVEVPEETKLRNVPGLIESIESKSGSQTITIHCMEPEFEGTEMTARHTDGTEVKVKVNNNYAIFDIPKDGTWTVSNTVTNETFTIVFDTNKELWYFKQATITVNCYKTGSSLNEWGIDGPDGCWKLTIVNPNEATIFNQRMTCKQMSYVMTQQVTTTVRGVHKVTLQNEYPSYSTSPYTKNVEVKENNKDYSISFTCHWQGYVVSDPDSPEQPGFDGQSQSPQSDLESEPIIYAVNTTDLTEGQINEIFETIDRMIEEGKSESEINSYIESMEAKYGTI